MIHSKDFNRHWIYSNLESAKRPERQCKDVPVPQFGHFSDESPESGFLKEASISSTKREANIFEESSTRTEQFSHEELSDLIRTSIFSKKLQKYRHIDSKKKNVFVLVQATFYHTRKLIPYLHTTNGLFSVYMFKDSF